MADTNERAPGLGGGVNQRALITMTPAEIDAFLQERNTATMCSINADGSIHAVAMWYGFLDGQVAFETKAKSQKVQNLRRNPNLTVAIETGTEYNELRGVSLVGTASFVENYDDMVPLGISVFERYQGPFTEEMRPFVDVMLRKRVVVKLDVKRTISWDHRKLA